MISVLKSNFDFDHARSEKYKIIESRDGATKRSAIASAYYENFKAQS